MKFLRTISFSERTYLIISIIIVLFIFGYFFNICYILGKICLLGFISLLAIDLVMIFGLKEGISGIRDIPKKLSLGDINELTIYLKSNYSFKTNIYIIDELPKQLQIRNFKINTILKPGEEKQFSYQIKPLKRGEYSFGKFYSYTSSFINLIIKKYSFDGSITTKVYPSFIQMRKFELFAISNRLTEIGIKKIRRVGKHSEFDQIREYVKGDDYRTINWKATARRGDLMVNQYQDEKSQQIYSILDMGRVMKMPFEGMSLLDYAINASLVISNIAINKHDKAGLITFNKKIKTVLPANRKNDQMLTILEVLYNQQTHFLESNFELLYVTIRKKIKQRSLLILYTNFESEYALKRQLKHLQQLSKSHLVLVIFFENTEIKNILSSHAKTLEDIYIKTISEKFIYEKKRMIKELNRYGIHAILTKPEGLTVKLINKYLELKAIGLI